MNPLVDQAIKGAESEISKIRQSIELVNSLPELPAKSINATAHTVYVHVESVAALQETMRLLKEQGWKMIERKSYGETIAYNFSHEKYPRFLIWQPLQVIINTAFVLDNVCV